MNIALLGNFNNQDNNKAEESMSSVLKELGHKVIEFDEKDYKADDIINADADLLLFFKGGVALGTKTLAEFTDMLYKVPYTKVCWYFDKVWGQNRIDFINAIMPVTDFVFMTDGEFVRRHNYFNLYETKQGVDADLKGGEYKKEFDIPIVFQGNIYGTRKDWAEDLKYIYGDAFQIINGVFDKDLEDLCKSAKIFVAPLYPQNNFYWSNRVYQVIGRGGFLIHPYLHNLSLEFEEGKHIEYYTSFKELVSKIEYYLEHEDERKKIAKVGQEHCLKNHSYKNALQDILNTIKNGI